MNLTEFPQNGCLPNLLTDNHFGVENTFVSGVLGNAQSWRITKTKKWMEDGICFYLRDIILILLSPFLAGKVLNLSSKPIFEE